MLHSWMKVLIVLHHNSNWYCTFISNRGHLTNISQTAQGKLEGQFCCSAYFWWWLSSAAKCYNYIVFHAPIHIFIPPLHTCTRTINGGIREVDPLFFHVVPPQCDIGNEKVISVSLSGVFFAHHACSLKKSL